MQLKEKEILRCIKECIMDDDSISTTKGKLYRVLQNETEFYIIDDENEPHYFDEDGEEAWSTYFEKTRALKLERILNYVD